MRAAPLQGRRRVGVNRRGLRSVALAALPGIVLTVIALSAIHAGYFVQTTASGPRGLWRSLPVSPDARWVMLCPPGDTGRALPGGAREGGPCGGYPRLVKPVVARAGDRVEIDAEGVRVNGRAIESSAAWRRADGTFGHAKPYPAGRYEVASDEVWVVSSWHPRSLDSRYFGPLRTRDLLGAAEPVLAW